MSLLNLKKLGVYDFAVLYVTTCSDVDVSFKNSRRFLECGVSTLVPKIGNEDRRYLVRCAEDLRKDIYKNGLFPAEAIVSEYSPFLMTKEFFEELRADDRLREQYLQEVEALILGKCVPEGLEHWQSEVNLIIRALDADVKDILSDIRADFTVEKMKMIPLKVTLPVR